ncbi:MAG: ribonuclease HII [Dokdonella sp.]
MNLELFEEVLAHGEFGRVAGVDEAGRGPLAGPVVIAAVILDPARPVEGLADSKVLCARVRDALALRIRECAIAYSICFVESDEIDRINILQATMCGMSRALAALVVRPSIALIDGNQMPRDLCCRARTIIGGDRSDAAISAASILAKTSRDALMRVLDGRHPGYGFDRHKGYPTAEHLRALSALGPCPQHRRSYAPVRRILESSTLQS